MNFSSIMFIFFFLPISLIIYYLVPKKLKGIVITIESLFFYAGGGLFSFAVLIASSAFDYLMAYCIYKYDDKPKLKKLALIISMVMNIFLLIILKKGGIDFSSYEIYNNNGVPLIIPLGISFYTLSKISYIIDIYMTKTKFDGSFLTFLFYVSFFPRISSATFQRYDDVKKDLNNVSVTFQKTGEGTIYFVKGLCKKVLLADNISMMWYEIKAMGYSEMTFLTAWLGIISFSMMIYFSFSGYCDMAYGIAKMFGFNIPKNFNHPYMAKSITDFWKRWHITLKKWFEIYLYKPLNKNKNKILTYVSIIIVYMLIGLWHGFTINFLCWSIYFAVLVIFEKCFFVKQLKKVPDLVGILYTLFMVIIGWVIFSGSSISDSLTYLKMMFGLRAGNLVSQYSLYMLTSHLTIIIICIFASTDLFKSFIIALRGNKKIYKITSMMIPLISAVLFVICIAYIVGKIPETQLYFRY